MIPNFSGDRISVEPLSYRKEKVLIVGETGAQRSIPINSDLRPSLSDAIFWEVCVILQHLTLAKFMFWEKEKVVSSFSFRCNRSN